MRIDRARKGNFRTISDVEAIKWIENIYQQWGRGGVPSWVHPPKDSIWIGNLENLQA